MLGKSEVDMVCVVFIILVLILLGAGVGILAKAFSRGGEYERELEDLG